MSTLISNLRSALDRERRAAGPVEEPGGLVQEWSADRSECRVVYCGAAPDGFGEVVRARAERARAERHELEWKLYAHDDRPGLAEALAAAGFEADDAELVLAAPLDPPPSFPVPDCEIRVVREAAGLEDMARISRAIGRRDVEAETRRLAAQLADGTDSLSIHIAYVDGEPASCGRLHYGRTEGFAELAGGRTVPEYRKRGLFTALVGSRLREAAERGAGHVFVDALPTSEPILRKCGFVEVCGTTPYLLDPRSDESE